MLYSSLKAAKELGYVLNLMRFRRVKERIYRKGSEGKELVYVLNLMRFRRVKEREFTENPYIVRLEGSG